MYLNFFNSNYPSPQTPINQSGQESPLREEASLELETLILFARTDREKEEWFSLFNKSAALRLLDSNTFAKLNGKKTQGFSITERNAASSIESNNLDLEEMKKTLNLGYSTSHDQIIYRLAESSSNASTSSIVDSKTSHESTGSYKMSLSLII